LPLNARRGLGRRPLTARRGARHRTTGASVEVVGVEAVRHVEDHPTSGEPPEQWPGNNHSRDRDGHPQRQRDAEVGMQQTDRGQRPWVRRHQPVHGGKPRQRWDSDGDERELRPLGDEVDDRHQQHEADLEEHRQADDGTHQRHCPRQRPRRCAPDDGVNDLVGAS
jgi:hypothetical protein